MWNLVLSLAILKRFYLRSIAKTLIYKSSPPPPPLSSILIVWFCSERDHTQKAAGSIWSSHSNGQSNRKQLVRALEGAHAAMQNCPVTSEKTFPSYSFFFKERTCPGDELA